MSIHKVPKKVNRLGDYILFISFSLIASASFAFGRLSVVNFEAHDSISIEYPPLVEWNDGVVVEEPILGKNTEILQNTGNFVASKNGTKYYSLDCGGVGRINEENKVWFNTEDDAVAGGYSRASGC